MDYCSAADLYLFGLPRGALPNPGRLAAAVSTVSSTFTLDVHGFALNDVVSFRAEAGGSLPAPLVAGVEYFAIPVTESTFSVALTGGGSAVALVSAGARVIVNSPLPIGAAIAWASALIDDMLPAHVVPLVEPIPELVKMTCAELASGKLLTRAGTASKSLTEMAVAARKVLERWSKGVPLRNADAQSPANLAVGRSACVRDRRGWRRWGGL